MEQNKLTLGSLFDGSGGFPLGGLISGITPVWASEIEGLDGSRSSLFYEAVRIAKEMRCKTNGRYPRYIVWENVPGAFSSNKGADFQSVLEEVCSVKGYEIHTPRPERWANAGEIMADDFSLAWRVFDAQYWGVPQRRKRIYLVADLAGGSAGKIPFESEGVSGPSIPHRPGASGMRRKPRLLSVPVRCRRRSMRTIARTPDTPARWRQPPRLCLPMAQEATTSPLWWRRLRR